MTKIERLRAELVVVEESLEVADGQTARILLAQTREALALLPDIEGEIQATTQKANRRREDRAIAWVAEDLGASNAIPRERAAVLLWEAIELAQAEGLREETMLWMIDHVTGRTPGIPEHEAANVAFAFFAYAASRGLKVAELFDAELARNQARSAEDLAASVRRKDEAGI